MDEWFWNLCANYLHKDDVEKLDMFRDIDLYKRVKNHDYVFMTHVRVKRDDDYIWTKLTFVFIPTENKKDVEKVFILVQDYSATMAERMTNLMYARIDALTQTWNRRYSEELITNRIKNNGNGLFCLFDVDNFKTINDSFGHITGDQLLKKISHIVCESITGDDVFGRLGGDEFVLYLKGDFQECINRLNSIMIKLKFNYYENDRKIKIECSAGLAKIQGRRASFNELYESADAALYEAKRLGKGNYKISLASLIEDDDE
jgi:diguanylate cyclase (GGDEF)-like protein